MKCIAQWETNLLYREIVGAVLHGHSLYIYRADTDSNGERLSISGECETGGRKSFSRADRRLSFSTTLGSSISVAEIRAGAGLCESI